MAFDREVAALTIYCEASGTSQDEREAVAHVIINRVRARRWSPTVAGVCTDYMQFSSWNGDKGSRRNLLRGMNAPDSDAVMQACVAAYDTASAPGATDPTNGATHYHDKSIAPPVWTDGALMTLETPHFKFYAGVR